MDRTAGGGRAGRDVAHTGFVRAVPRIVAVARLGDVQAAESEKKHPGSMSESSMLESYDIFRDFARMSCWPFNILPLRIQRFWILHFCTRPLPRHPRGSDCRLGSTPSRVLPLQFGTILAVVGFFDAGPSLRIAECHPFGTSNRLRTLIFNVHKARRRINLRTETQRALC